MKIFKNTLEWLETAKPKKPVTLEEKIELVQKVKKWMIEEMDEMIEALNNNDENEVIDALIDNVTFSANLPYYLNLDLDKISEYADKVNQSNWSKYCMSINEAMITCDLYKKGTHPDKIGEKIDAYYVQEGKYFIIKKTEDNKILKSFLYKNPTQF